MVLIKTLSAERSGADCVRREPTVVGDLRFHFLDVKTADYSVLKIKNKVYQRKFDGNSVESFIDDNDGNIRLFGRGVLEYGILSEYTKRFPEIIKALKSLSLPGGTDFVGELIVVDPKTGFEKLELIQIRTQRSGANEGSVRIYPAKLIILDVVMVGGVDVRSLKYFDRIRWLKNLKDPAEWKKVENIINFVENSYELNWKFIEENNLEGVVIRDVDAYYGKGIWKLKREVTEDVYCRGEYNESDTMIGLFSSLICYQIDKNGKEIYVADVGGGFSEDERKDMQKLLDSGIMKKYPLVIEIKTNGKMSSGKCRSPIFKRIRYDKPYNQCIIN